MVSYFFKSGQRHLGAEFMHKSFREYLFAEHIVETLKAYGRGRTVSPEPRERYWEDFAKKDPRYKFSRNLALLFAANWLSTEVSFHLAGLLRWEIERAADPKRFSHQPDQTEPLTLQEWEHVRDGLADLWDWWGEGVHLRPQSKKDVRGSAVFRRSYADGDLVTWSSPLAMEPDDIPVPVRTVSVDAHLGDGLCRLATIVHFQVAGGGPAILFDVLFSHQRRRVAAAKPFPVRTGSQWS
jgi:hypothetical protein